MGIERHSLSGRFRRITTDDPVIVFEFVQSVASYRRFEMTLTKNCAIVTCQNIPATVGQ